MSRSPIVHCHFMLHFYERINNNDDYYYYYPFESYGGVPNFKFRSRDHDHDHFMGQFVVHWLVYVILNVCTKYEVSFFNHSEDIKGVPKFRNWLNFHTPTKGFMQCISPHNLEYITLSVRKLLRGPKF